MNYNQNTQTSPAGLLKTIPIIYMALLAGQALFGAVTFINAKAPFLNLKPDGDVFFFLVPLFIIASGFAGLLLFKRKITDLAGLASLKERMAAYQTSLITRYALTEGSTLFGIVVFMLSGNLFYLLLVGLNILYFLSFWPTKQRMQDDLNLSYEDKIELGE